MPVQNFHSAAACQGLLIRKTRAIAFYKAMAFSLTKAAFCATIHTESRLLQPAGKNLELFFQKNVTLSFWYLNVIYESTISGKFFQNIRRKNYDS